MNWIQRSLLRIVGTKQIATLVETWKLSQPQYAETSFSNLAKEGYRKNELIFSCIQKKAATSAQVGMIVTSKSAGKKLPDHPLQKLIKNPNPNMSEYDLWSAIIIYQDLAGRAIFEKQRNNAGEVIALWPLRPDYVRPIPSQDNFIGGYSYEVPGLPAQIISAQDVVDFKVFDPLNWYNSWPPVAVAARVGEVDNSATDFLKLFWEQGGTPPGLIKTVQKLRDTDAADLRRRWGERYGGYRSWMEPAVLDRDADYQRIGFTFQEMGFEVLDARNEARLCMVLRVPPIMVGAKVGLDRSTFSNYKEARQSWWEDDLVPIYVNFQDAIQSQLLPEFGDDITAEWNFSNVPALREERLVLWQRANEGLKMGGITVNEYRVEIGLEGLGKTGDVFLRPLNLVEVPLGQSQNDIQQSIASQAQGTIDQQIAEIEGEQEEGIKALLPDFEEKSGSPSDIELRRKIERKIQRKAQAYLSDQRKRIVQELNKE